MKLASKHPTLSLVIPLLNEAEILPTTYRRVVQELAEIGESFEIIFVNDGSTDSSLAVLAEISRHDGRVVVVNLARNFGHELATSAGIRHTRGKAVVILDADLQDPPELISRFVTEWRRGFDVVYGVRRRRDGESLLKRFTSACFYRLMERISDVPIPRDTGDFRLMDRRVIDVFNELKENPRFFRGMVSWIGFRQCGVPFDRQPRIGGQSKYRYHRLVSLAFDTITSFSLFPAQALLLLAFLVVTGATVVSLWAVADALFRNGPWNTTHVLLLAVLWVACSGVCSLAVVAQYVVRTHRTTQNRPLFTIESVVRGGRAKRPNHEDAKAA